MDKEATRRLFFGLEIPTSVKQRLLSIQQPVAGARWQRADQLHLTLVFLGRVEAQQLPAIREAARNLPVKPFDLTVTGLGCFGSPDHPRNLWAGVQPVGKLAEMQSALSKRLASSGFGQEGRSFQPHITLARFKRDAGSVAELLQTHERRHAGSFLVGWLTLFESLPRQGGSVYHVVDRFPLAG
ncbi:RNA 2',3'-cyclic phosphodiesterase [Marinobacter orientalis]|uniref:RNA 2',3'-cyclic phosphodiesterase n=1 Tax=Marinobacter orientalis TaxID=1928859 RepID=A0A7Y0RDJ0_9GAMM|nr:RNA 2',3'-cyclic phosphodiesterase [Marinobacter orientalis]NMT64260.1 RNA 2',3'-cyclic phosphodiesterase [Marinobacter orientalis]TGX49481.1 RNA 2',3'-cyclic phosphodiesterase [Marinobacter orientalis]